MSSKDITSLKKRAVNKIYGEKRTFKRKKIGHRKNIKV